MSNFNPYAAPQSDITDESEHFLEKEGLWQDGSLLVIRKGTELPDRCLKCNEPADGYRIKRTLSWHRPGWFLLVLISPLLYLIVALCVRWTAKVAAGLCPRHCSALRRAIFLGWLGSLAGIGLIVFGASHPDYALAILVGVFAVGVFALLGSIIYGVAVSQVMVPKRIDRNFVWLKKVSPDYLATLPGWK